MSIPSEQYDLSRISAQVAEHGAEIKSLTNIVREFVQSQEKINATLFSKASPNMANLIALVGVVSAIVTMLGFFIFRDIDTTKTTATMLVDKQRLDLTAIDTSSHERDAMQNGRLDKLNDRIGRSEDHQWEMIRMDLEELHQRRMQQEKPQP